MSCGANTCRHELQATLAQLNPEAAWSAQLMAVQRSRLASWQRALRAGTAADARAVTGADTEQVGRCCCCLPARLLLAAALPHLPTCCLAALYAYHPTQSRTILTPTSSHKPL